MSSKKFTKWIDEKNYKTCFKIVQKYYLHKQLGLNINFFSKEFLTLFTKRLFFILVNLFRFNRNPYKKYLASPDIKHFFKRLLGIYNLELENLLPEKPVLKQLQFPLESKPLVSIIIAVYNHFNYTYNCLHSILLNTEGVSYEIIIINDQSTDETATQLRNIENIKYLENEENLGFLKSCNKAAKIAKGKYLCFLNNDTQVRPRWLHNMVMVFNTDRDAGLVGAKLIYPYGLLQEAGGLINHLGEPINYGRYQNPDLSGFNYLRETDYCSGACILVKREFFEQLNGFDERYAPAYYEDTDLCLAIRHVLGKKVYYQPLTEVVHFEGISSGKIVKPGSIKEYQLINAQKFQDKWTEVLKSFPPLASSIDIAGKFNYKKTILFIDVIIPEHDKASGYKRMFELLKIFKSLNFNVLFLPNDGNKTYPYFSELTNLGIRILYPTLPHQSPISELLEVIHTIDIAWISRPELNEIYGPFVKKQSSILWAYDTVDLHFIREERGLKLQHVISEEEKELINSIMATEIQLSKEADITIAITETEAEILVAKGAKRVEVIPNVHIPYTGALKDFNERDGICFIGGYHHQPNVDAVMWLANEIMPIIWRNHPEIKLTVMGSHPTSAILALQSQKIEVTGYIEDVSNYFTSSRICVAPLRYGAGMKGKIGQSLEFGLPVITTDIGAEGMNLKHGHNVLIANTTEDFAREIIELYYNEPLWRSVASNSSLAIAQYSPTAITNTLKEIF